MSEISRGVFNVFSIALSIAAFMSFLVGSYDYFKNHETNRCQMTYMFQYPEYIQINVEADKTYRMYGLYYYAEEPSDISKARNQAFNGIPVLFLPGNGGSHKQVRSFASVALRKHQDANTPFHFDFFSISFNEELSGLYGYVLERQSEFSRICLEKIRSLYEDFHTVIVIGHSQGGLIARSLLGNGVTIFLTLSAPHSHPILLTDPEQDIFYYKLSRNWSEPEFTSKTLVSLAGGERDFLVPEKYTASRHNDIHINTPGIPTVWASSDHLCIVWCKQVVLSVVRSLFDLVQYNNGYYSISNSNNYTKDVFNYHLINRSRGKSFRTPLEDLKNNGEFVETLKMTNCMKVSRTTYVMVPMIIVRERMNAGDDYGIVIMTNSTRSKDWVFGCENQSIQNGVRYCSEGKNLSPHGNLLPSYLRRKKVLHLDGNVQYSHIVIRLDASTYPVCANVEVYDRQTKILKKFETEGKLFHNFTIDYSKVFAYDLKAVTKCAKHDSVAIFTNGNLKHHAFLTNSTLLMYYSDPKEEAYVELYLDPSCKISILPSVSVLKTLGNVFQRYMRLLPSFIASTIIMCLFLQEDAEWRNFHIVMLTNGYCLTVIPGFGVSFLLSVFPNDWLQMLDKEEYNSMLPIYMYSISYVVVLAIATLSWYLIVAAGSAANAIFMKLITTRVGQLMKWRMPTKMTEIAVDFTFSKFPVTISVLLVSLSLSTCGALAISITVFLHYLKLFKMYEDILEDLTRCRIQSVQEALSPINFLFSCSLLWLVVSLLNLPSLLYWINNFSFGDVPQYDLSLYLALMLLPTIAVLWQENAPSFHPLIWQLHRYMLLLMSLCLVLFASFRLYIISFIISVVLMTTAICHLLSSIANYGIQKIEQQQETVNEEENEAVASSSGNEESGGETEDEELYSEVEDEKEKEKKMKNGLHNDVDNICEKTPLLMQNAMKDALEEVSNIDPGEDPGGELKK